jgi:hypothetical protein
MLRPALTVAALALAVTGAGCGGDDASSTPAGAVRTYNDAVADGNGDMACGRLADSAQKELQRSTQGSARGSCKQVIDLLGAFYDDATKDRLRDAKVAAAQTGDTARARFTSPVAFGGPDREQTYELRRFGDSWKITSLGFAPTDPGTVGP